MKKILTIGILLTTCLVLTLAMFACEMEPNDNQETIHHPRVQFVFSTGDVVTVELYPEKAPITVANFLTYVEEGFYRGTVIHRVANYVVQGGGYTIKDYTYTPKAATHPAITGEFASNSVTGNDVSHTAGAISMARDPKNLNSATSQFFFCPIDCTGWDGDYAAFGHVVDEASLAAIVRLSQMPADEEEWSKSAIVINSVTLLED